MQKQRRKMQPANILQPYPATALQLFREIITFMTLCSVAERFLQDQQKAWRGDFSKSQACSEPRAATCS